MLTDHFFGCAPEQNAVRQQDNSSSVFVHVVNHVLHKSKVSLALRRKFAVFIETLVLHEVHISRPICRIRRICNLNTELHVSEVVMFKRIAIVDIEVTVRDATKDHVHSGKVIGGRGQFLTVVVTHICIVLETKQQRAGAASRIGCVLNIGQAKTSKAAQQLGRTRRRIELTGFLTGCGSELTDQILVGITQHINLRVIHAEIDLVQRSNDFRHDSTSIFNGMPQLRRIELHIGEQSVKVFL